MTSRMRTSTTSLRRITTRPIPGAVGAFEAVILGDPGRNRRETSQKYQTDNSTGEKLTEVRMAIIEVTAVVMHQGVRHENDEKDTHNYFRHAQSRSERNSKRQQRNKHNQYQLRCYSSGLTEKG